METAQWRVLAMLGIAGAINVGYNQQSRKNLTSAVDAIGHGDLGAAGQYVNHVLFWLLSIAFVLLLAAGAPKVATWLAALVLLWVVLSHGTQLIATFSPSIPGGAGDAKNPPF